MSAARSEKQTEQKKVVHTGVVESVERLTPHMFRVVLGGDGLAHFEHRGFTDSYVKLLFPVPGTELPETLDLDEWQQNHPRVEWPVKRTYTVRSWDPANRRLTIDFVYHGDVGIAGPWAANARPGDRLHLRGPGGAYRPASTADWHLLAGDESALPAIATALEALPMGTPAHVYIEVDGPADEQRLPHRAGVQVNWLHRGSERIGTPLVRAVRELDFPAGNVHAFVHGEAHFVKELRSLLRVDHGVSREQLSISGYWRRGRDEDAWQATKAEWNQQVEAEEAARTAA